MILRRRSEGVLNRRCQILLLTLVGKQLRYVKNDSADRPRLDNKE
ncbi:hypothetical protein L53_05930 [Hyphomonas sp. L-53-1-40]|nr:hypothetical protein L53_05930 [Hyphomonas sp. L-53-1-40]